ncbi:MAG: vWA domain-containing protein [Pirellulales bacterium]
MHQSYPHEVDRRSSLTEALGSSLSLEVPVWLASMFAHMALILWLGTRWMPVVPQPEKPEILASIDVVEQEPKPQELQKQKFDFRPSELPNIGSARTAGVEVEVSTALKVTETVELPRLPPQSRMLTDIRVPLIQDLVTAPTRGNKSLIKGVAGDGATGTLGALDRITQEILLSLERGPTLVVWFFDQSGSMQVQRETVRNRFDKIYQELGLSTAVDVKPGEPKPLLSSIVAFGKEITFRTERPTDDLTVLKNAIDGIENDDSGVEMTFTALGTAAEKYQSFRFHTPRRRVLMVVFTDEVGEDENRSEECITVCKRNQMPVYVVGVPAPFGRPNIEIKYVDPDPTYDQSVQWIPVRQGPETFLPEQVLLNFSGKPNRDDGIYRMDSGFGPYCLTRLAWETGGIFFAVHSNRERIGDHVTARETPVFQARLNHFFDPLVMKPYRPDYLPLNDYVSAVKKNKAKSALVEAARQSTLDPMQGPTLVFRKVGEDESSMKQALDEAQKKAAIVMPKLDVLYSILKDGEKDREKLVEPRWRAGFDLAYGRVLAVKVRTEAYNSMLARAKNGLKLQDPKSNVFTLEAVDEVTVNSTLEKMAAKARELLTRVATEHRGTPWAMVAEQELKDPIGWRWKESYDPPPAPRPSSTAPAANNPPRPNNQPPQFRRENPKPRRTNIRL